VTRIVALASAKGSPGCSFVAVGLARCLADAGLRTLLVDADAEERGLAGLLGLEPGAGGEQQAGERLSLLELPLDAAAPGARSLAASLRGAADAVVADLGHHPGELQAELAVGSDWLLWVVSPDAGGVERAARALASGRLLAASTGLVLNRVRGRPDLAPLEGARLPVLARLPRDERAARGSRPPHRTRSFGRPLRELARSLHPRAPQVPPSWP
jgi:MinD-like ATPase involved in chromosome partitioning or flagellar assembly